MKSGGFSSKVGLIISLRPLVSSVNALGKVYLVALRWLVPIAIILIFLNSLGVL